MNVNRVHRRAYLLTGHYEEIPDIKYYGVYRSYQDALNAAFREQNRLDFATGVENLESLKITPVVYYGKLKETK